MQAYFSTNNSRSEWYKCKLVLVYSRGFANLFIEIFFIHINTFFTSYRGSEKTLFGKNLLIFVRLRHAKNLLPLLLSIPCTSTSTSTHSYFCFVSVNKYSRGREYFRQMCIINNLQ